MESENQFSEITMEEFASNSRTKSLLELWSDVSLSCQNFCEDEKSIMNEFFYRRAGIKDFLLTENYETDFFYHFEVIMFEATELIILIDNLNPRTNDGKLINEEFVSLKNRLDIKKFDAIKEFRKRVEKLTITTNCRELTKNTLEIIIYT